MKIQVEHNPSRGTYWWALLNGAGSAVVLSVIMPGAAEANRSAREAADQAGLSVELWPETKGTP